MLQKNYGKYVHVFLLPYQVVFCVCCLVICLSKSLTSLVFLSTVYFKSIEDVDSPPKELEVDTAKVVAKIPGVRLDHLPEETGKTAALYHGKEVRPDITGTYNGQRFVMDTKHYEKSYIKSSDVNKIKRDKKATGECICSYIIFACRYVHYVHVCVYTVKPL